MNSTSAILCRSALSTFGLDYDKCATHSFEHRASLPSLPHHQIGHAQFILQGDILRKPLGEAEKSLCCLS